MTNSGGPISQISRTRAARLLAAVALPVILWLTLRGDPHAASAVDLTPWWCVSCGPAGTADQLQNLLLFVPLGLAAGLAGWGMGTTGIAMLALTLTIEGSQALLGSGRDAALGDVIANGLGGLLGWWVVQLGGRRWLAVRHAAAPIGVGLFVAQLVATASLSGPSPVGPEPWHLRLQPETEGRPSYRGTITRIELDGRSILTGAGPRQQARSNAVANLHAEFTWDPPESSMVTPIARLDDTRGWSIVALDRRGSRIGMSLRTRAALVRLREPTWMIAVPPTARLGDTLQLALDLQPGLAAVSISGPDHGTSALRFRRGAQHGWALINPFVRSHHSVAVWDRWTLVWLFGWGVVIGLATLPARRAVLWLGAALGGLVLMSTLAGAPTTAAEGLALLLGWAVVGITGSWFRRQRIEA